MHILKKKHTSLKNVSYKSFSSDIQAKTNIFNCKAETKKSKYSNNISSLILKNVNLIHTKCYYKFYPIFFQTNIECYYIYGIDTLYEAFLLRMEEIYKNQSVFDLLVFVCRCTICQL